MINDSWRYSDIYVDGEIFAHTDGKDLLTFLEIEKQWYKNTEMHIVINMHTDTSP